MPQLLSGLYCSQLIVGIFRGVISPCQRRTRADPQKPDARHVQGALNCYCIGPASQTVDQHKTSSGAFNNAPSKHATSTQSRVNVRRTTKTVGQHWVEVTCFLEMWGFQLKHFKPHFTPKLFSLLNIYYRGSRFLLIVL